MTGLDRLVGVIPSSTGGATAGRSAQRCAPAGPGRCSVPQGPCPRAGVGSAATFDRDEILMPGRFAADTQAAGAGCSHHPHGGDGGRRLCPALLALTLGVGIEARPFEIMVASLE